MRGQAGFFDVDERLKQLSAKGDSLERLNAVVDFALFRADLEQAVPRSDREKGGRPPFDPVLMFKVLVLQTSHNLSDERTEYPGLRACEGFQDCSPNCELRHAERGSSIEW
jgi:transposase, IS5 family